MLGVLPVSFPSVLSVYIKYDLRKNKIVMASITLFLGISTKFEALASKLRH